MFNNDVITVFIFLILCSFICIVNVDHIHYSAFTGKTFDITNWPTNQPIYASTTLLNIEKNGISFMDSIATTSIMEILLFNQYAFCFICYAFVFFVFFHLSIYFKNFHCTIFLLFLCREYY